MPIGSVGGGAPPGWVKLGGRVLESGTRSQPCSTNKQTKPLFISKIGWFTRRLTWELGGSGPMHPPQSWVNQLTVGVGLVWGPKSTALFPLMNWNWSCAKHQLVNGKNYSVGSKIFVFFLAELSNKLVTDDAKNSNFVLKNAKYLRGLWGEIVGISRFFLWNDGNTKEKSKKSLGNFGIPQARLIAPKSQ